MVDVWTCFYCRMDMEQPEVAAHLSKVHSVTTKDMIDVEYTGSVRDSIEHVFWCVPSDRRLRNDAVKTREKDK